MSARKASAIYRVMSPIFPGFDPTPVDGRCSGQSAARLSTAQAL